MCLATAIGGVCAALPAAAAATGADPASAAAPGSSVATGRLLVTLEPSAPAPAADPVAAAASIGARPSGVSVPQIGLVTVKPRPGESLTALAARLRADPAVATVQREHRLVPRAVPNDPALTQLETLAGTPANTPVQWWAARERFPQAWAITHGRGARVAIIDTGADANHPELSGRIVYRNDLDDLDAGSARVDEDGHGTHVASLACATADNGIGIAGAGYACSLLIEKSDFSDGSIAAAIVDAADHHADAINMSFGSDGTVPAPQAEIDALRYARKKGAVLVAAAADTPVREQGDPSNVLQPTGTGRHPAEGIGLSVTAAQSGGTRAWFAGYGSQISVAAYGAYSATAGRRGLLGAFPANHALIEDPDPGVPQANPPIPATPACGCRVAFRGDTRYAYLAGTSMAAPQVTAVAAMMRHLNPALTPAVVEQLIKRTARRPKGTGWTSDLGWGILDAGAAVVAARDTDRTRPTARLSVVSRGHASVVVRVTARDPHPPGARASGVRGVRIYRTVGSRRTLWRTVGVGTTRVHAPAGTLLRLTPRAVDRAGNVQALRSRPSVRVRVTP
jgi:subtilisin family serine protease